MAEPAIKALEQNYTRQGKQEELREILEEIKIQACNAAWAMRYVEW